MPAISRRVESGTGLPAVGETAPSFGSCLRRSQWWWSRYLSAHVTFRIAERRKLVSVIYQKSRVNLSGRERGQPGAMEARGRQLTPPYLNATPIRFAPDDLAWPLKVLSLDN